MTSGTCWINTPAPAPLRQDDFEASPTLSPELPHKAEPQVPTVVTNRLLSLLARFLSLGSLPLQITCIWILVSGTQNKIGIQGLGSSPTGLTD